VTPDKEEKYEISAAFDGLALTETELKLTLLELFS
jgi:hypothetical protein